MENIRINTEEIKNLSNKLSMHGEQLLSAFYEDANVALNMGKECLVLTGLSIEEFFDALHRTYDSLHDRIETLATFLNNYVAMGYDETAQVTANNFNNKLGSQLSALLGISATGGIGIKDGVPFQIEQDLDSYYSGSYGVPGYDYNDPNITFGSDGRPIE